MERMIATINLRSALGSPILGDTLFGQLCWVLRGRYGEQRLNNLLQGYTAGSPFVVLSDALPAGHLPLPDLPLSRFTPITGATPKELKKRRWIVAEKLNQSIESWLGLAVEMSEAERHLQPHNSINRTTDTTGKGEFAPYTQEQLWMKGEGAFQIYLLFDKERIEQQEVEQLIRDIGNVGYGRDASIGLGKYELTAFEKGGDLSQEGANASITLAPTAPQGLGFDAQMSCYTPFTRFGKHGDRGVHQGHPFKTPLLLVKRGALLVDGSNRYSDETGHVGQGIGGRGLLSATIQQTVHQGYAPVVRVRVEAEQ